MQRSLHKIFPGQLGLVWGGLFVVDLTEVWSLGQRWLLGVDLVSGILGIPYSLRGGRPRSWHR